MSSDGFVVIVEDLSYISDGSPRARSETSPRSRGIARGAPRRAAASRARRPHRPVVVVVAPDAWRLATRGSRPGGGPPGLLGSILGAPERRRPVGRRRPPRDRAHHRAANPRGIPIPIPRSRSDADRPRGRARPLGARGRVRGGSGARGRVRLLPSIPTLRRAAARRAASSSLSLREQKLKLAATSRRVATLRKKLDDIPSPLETAQYERRLAELHALARRRHAEHREAFEDYNALCDELETLRKELGILDSLRSQLGLLPEPGVGGDRDDDARVPAGWTIDAETREAVARSLLSVESGVGRATAAARARARRAGEGLREARRRVREAEAAERKYLETLRA